LCIEGFGFRSAIVSVFWMQVDKGLNTQGKKDVDDCVERGILSVWLDIQEGGDDHAYFDF
jgi:hypothetical protein